jgi:hypothetical protein
MKNRSILIVAILSLGAFGCGKGGSDCASLGPAIEHQMDAEMNASKDAPAEMKKQAEEMMKAIMPKMKAVLTKSCSDDKWPGDAIKCMTSAKSMRDMQGCDSKLSAEQKANVEKAMTAAMRDMPGVKKRGAADPSVTPTEGAPAPATP